MTTPNTNTSGLFNFPPDLTWADQIFDQMMVSRAAVYRKDQVLDELNNISNVTFIELVRDVPCAVRSLKGEELNTPPAPASQTSTGIQQFLIFMRPLMVDEPPIAINIRHWLQILTPAQVAAGIDYSDPSDPNAQAVLYNLTNVSNPYQIDHHYELSATVLTP